MADARITIDFVGGSGCGRGAERLLAETEAHRRPPVLELQPWARCQKLTCPDCLTIEFLDRLKACSQVTQVTRAILEHTPAMELLDGRLRGRASMPGPVDDLLAGTRSKRFGQ